MKTFVLCLVALGALGVVLADQSEAATGKANRAHYRELMKRRHKKQSGGAIDDKGVLVNPKVDVLKRGTGVDKSGVLVEPKVDVFGKGSVKDKGVLIDPKIDITDFTHGIDIKSFKAIRTESGILLTGVLANNLQRNVRQVNYTFLKNDGTGWKTIEGSRLPMIGAGQSRKVEKSLPASNNRFQFRLIVSADGKDRTKDAKLGEIVPPQKVIVIHYQSNGWILVGEQVQEDDTDHLIGYKLEPLAKRLRDEFGLQTQMHIKKTTGLFGDTTRTRLFTQAATKIEREFDSEEEANAFVSELRKLTRNLDGQSLSFMSFQKSER